MQQAVTHSCTNLAWRRATSVIGHNASPLCHASNPCKMLLCRLQCWWTHGSFVCGPRTASAAVRNVEFQRYGGSFFAIRLSGNTSPTSTEWGRLYGYRASLLLAPSGRTARQTHHQDRR